MRIGIDAKWYYSGPPSGVNVVRNIVNSLIKENTEHKLFIFLNREDKILNYEDKIFQNNNVICVYIPRKVNFITNLFFFPLYFYKYNLDVILFQNFVPFYNLGSTQYINYIHDFLFLDYPQYFSLTERVIYSFIKSSLKKSNHIITISISEQKRIIKHTKISSDSISYVYHGVDEKFHERSVEKKLNIVAKYKLPSKYILYVGRINIRKNIKTLLEGFSQIYDTEIALVIVGKEENNDINFLETICRLNIEKRVFVIGHIPDDDLVGIFSAAKIFVFPSFAEGFGLPPLEAMKSGVPSIVSDIASLNEICEDCVLYFNPNNVFELKDNMNLLLENNHLYNNLKQKGLNRAEKFEWDNSAREILKIITNTTNKNNNNEVNCK
jgi:glycosyltransferase involved in cell wall biosynthesis